MKSHLLSCQLYFKLDGSGIVLWLADVMFTSAAALRSLDHQVFVWREQLRHLLSLEIRLCQSLY
jgi:hypothetical protein